MSLLLTLNIFSNFFYVFTVDFEQVNVCWFQNLTDALSSSTISPLMCCVNAEKWSEHFTMKSEANVSITVRGW